MKGLQDLPPDLSTLSCPASSFTLPLHDLHTHTHTRKNTHTHTHARVNPFDRLKQLFKCTVLWAVSSLNLSFFFSLRKNTDALHSSIYYPDKMEQCCLFHCTLAKHKSDLVTEKVGQTSAKTSIHFNFSFCAWCNSNDNSLWLATVNNCDCCTLMLCYFSWEHSFQVLVKT